MKFGTMHGGHDGGRRGPWHPSIAPVNTNCITYVEFDSPFSSSITPTNAAAQVVVLAHVYKPVPRAIARCVLPRGDWLPNGSRAAFGGPIGSYTHPWRHMWLLFPCVTIASQVLLSTPSGCDVVGSLLCLLLLCCAIGLLWWKPHRALLCTVTAAARLLGTMLSSLFGIMLCRHGVVGADVVGQIALVASVLSTSTSFIDLGVSMLARWLVQRNTLLLVRDVVERNVSQTTALLKLIQLACRQGRQRRIDEAML